MSIIAQVAEENKNLGWNLIPETITQDREIQINKFSSNKYKASGAKDYKGFGKAVLSSTKEHDLKIPTIQQTQDEVVVKNPYSRPKTSGVENKSADAFTKIFKAKTFNNFCLELPENRDIKPRLESCNIKNNKFKRFNCANIDEEETSRKVTHPINTKVQEFSPLKLFSSKKNESLDTSTVSKGFSETRENATMSYKEQEKVNIETARIGHNPSYVYNSHEKNFINNNRPKKDVFNKNTGSNIVSIAKIEINSILDANKRNQDSFVSSDNEERKILKIHTDGRLTSNEIQYEKLISEGEIVNKALQYEKMLSQRVREQHLLSGKSQNVKLIKNICHNIKKNNPVERDIFNRQIEKTNKKNDENNEDNEDNEKNDTINPYKYKSKKLDVFTKGDIETSIAVSLRRCQSKRFLFTTPLGEYKVIKNLGSGSYGKVKLMQNTLTGDEFAVKIIRRIPPNKYHREHKEHKRAKVLDRRVLREANLSAVLGELNPHIVGIRDFRMTDAHFYLFYDYINGPTLAERIGSKGICEQEAREIFKPIVETIKFCHSYSIIHRDIKLENILLDYSTSNTAIKLTKKDQDNAPVIDKGVYSSFIHSFGQFNKLVEKKEITKKNVLPHINVSDRDVHNCVQIPIPCVKLIDFGLANFFSQKGLMETFCGSLPYTAPEILRGDPYFGPEIDVWSLGVMLYVMITGKFPFEDPSQNKNYEKIMRGRFKLYEYMSRELKSLLRSMLEPNIGSRITIEKVLSHPWFKENSGVYDVAESGCCLLHPRVDSKCQKILPGEDGLIELDNEIDPLVAKEVAVCLDIPVDFVSKKIKAVIKTSEINVGIDYKSNNSEYSGEKNQIWNSKSNKTKVKVQKSPIISMYYLIAKQIELRKWYLQTTMDVMQHKKFSKSMPNILEDRRGATEETVVKRSLREGVFSKVFENVSNKESTSEIFEKNTRKKQKRLISIKSVKNRLSEFYLARTLTVGSRKNIQESLEAKSMSIEEKISLDFSSTNSKYEFTSIEDKTLRPLKNNKYIKEKDKIRRVGCLESIKDRIVMPKCLNKLEAVQIMQKVVDMLRQSKISSVYVNQIEIPNAKNLIQAEDAMLASPDILRRASMYIYNDATIGLEYNNGEAGYSRDRGVITDKQPSLKVKTTSGFKSNYLGMKKLNSLFHLLSNKPGVSVPQNHSNHKNKILKTFNTNKLILKTSKGKRGKSGYKYIGNVDGNSKKIRKNRRLGCDNGVKYVNSHKKLTQSVEKMIINHHGAMLPQGYVWTIKYVRGKNRQVMVHETELDSVDEEVKTSFKEMELSIVKKESKIEVPQESMKFTQPVQYPTLTVVCRYCPSLSGKREVEVLENYSTTFRLELVRIDSRYVRNRYAIVVNRLTGHRGKFALIMMYLKRMMSTLQDR